MKKSKVSNAFFYKLIALSGGFLWVLTIPLREMVTNNNNLITFILGVLPNFGVAIFTPFIIIVVMFERKIYDKNLLKKVFNSMLFITMIILLTSEIIHEVYMNSLFDINDILVSLLALVLDALIFNFLIRKTKFNYKN